MTCGSQSVIVVRRRGATRVRCAVGSLRWVRIAGMHRLMRELLTLVPPDGEPWARESRERWMRALGAVADVVYEDQPRRSPGVPAPFTDGPPRAADPRQHGALPGQTTVDLRDGAPAPAGRHSKHRRPEPAGPPREAADGAATGAGADSAAGVLQQQA